MSAFRLFCFKQFFKVHIFCLLMLVVFRIFMNMNFNFFLWVVFILSTLCSGIYLLMKPFMVTRDIYAITAVLSCISLSIIARRFLWVALRIDLINMMYFFLSMLVFAVIIAIGMKFGGRRRSKKYKNAKARIKKLRYIGWFFLLFLFFYQLILSYLLRPNFLTVMALTISHVNLLLVMWTYFDVRRLYKEEFYSI